MENNFDIVIIGGGPAGYVAAIRAAQLGFKVACIEKRKTLGGTCLNVGCIPSKALLKSSEIYEQTNLDLLDHGIKVTGVELNLTQMMKRKNQVVENLCKGIDGLFRKNKITHFNGLGKLKDKNTIAVIKDDNQQEIIKTKYTIIATGSEVTSLPNITIDEEKIVSSTGALELKKVPKQMVVIGGGYIGLELGSVWRRLGAEVTVIEYLDRIVPTMDHEIGQALYKSLQKQGIIFKLKQKVISAVIEKDIVKLTTESAIDNKQDIIKADIVLMSVGRKPYTKGLGLDELAIKTDPQGKIIVNESYQTNIESIYAVGDVISGPMLAHKAEEEAVAVIELIANQSPHVNYDAIPSVIYTYPEVGSVGKTEEELKKANIDYKVGKFPFMANSRARAVNEQEGLVKILACSSTDTVLGVHIIGTDAGTLIAEATLALEYKASSEDIARTCHAHPTLNEAVKEAALSVLGRAIHI